MKTDVIYNKSSDNMSEVADDSVNLILTSPPYFGCRVYDGEEDGLGRELDPRDFVNNLMPYMMECHRILSKDGNFYLNMGDSYFGNKGFKRNKGKFKRKTTDHYNDSENYKEDGGYLKFKQLLMIPDRVAIKMQDEGWILRNKIIWKKNNAMPHCVKDRRQATYETIFHFVKTKKNYFDYDEAKKLQHHKDVISYNIEPYKKHQATFPVGLITPFVLTSSRPGDIVLDPFMGSGTTAVVAYNSGRKYIGYEQSEKYCKIIYDRIREEASTPNMFDGIE
jgi:site-specific DNA-methyltransferase (adenine-specific)